MFLVEIIAFLFFFALFIGLVLPLAVLILISFLVYALMTCSNTLLLVPLCIWKTVWLLWWYCCECYFPLLCPQIRRIPGRQDELTPVYFTTHLRRSGILSTENEVVGVKSTANEVQGFVSHVFAVTLSYKTPETKLPEKILIKVSVRMARLRLSMMFGRLTRAEIGFFRNYEDQVPFNHPIYHFSEFSPLSEKFLLALEYIEHPFVKPMTEYNMPLSEILKIIPQLARFHAQFEGRQAEFSTQFMAINDPVLSLVCDVMWKTTLGSFYRNMQVIGVEVPQEINELLEIVGTLKPSKLNDIFASIHQTPSHGDLRNENIYKMTSGDYGFVDFQLMGNRCLLYDVLYLCLSADSATGLNNRNQICELYYKEWCKHYDTVHGKDAGKSDGKSAQEEVLLPNRKSAQAVLTLQEVKLQFETVHVFIFMFGFYGSISIEAMLAETGDKREVVCETYKIAYLRIFDYVSKMNGSRNLNIMIKNYDSGKPALAGINVEVF